MKTSHHVTMLTGSAGRIRNIELGKAVLWCVVAVELMGLASCSRAVGQAPCSAACVRASARSTDGRVRANDPPSNESLTDKQTRMVLQSASIDPDKINCNARVIWVVGLKDYAQIAATKLAKLWGINELTPAQEAEGVRVISGYVVRMLFEQVKTQNLGVMRLQGHSYTNGSGTAEPLLIFRSGITTDAAVPDSCLKTLIKYGKVRHVLNLYAGDFPLHDFIRTEGRVARALGATHEDLGLHATQTNRWRSFIRSAKTYQQNKAWAMAAVAKVIRSQILQPEGAAPKGNIYMHCAGGMHRSGMIFGILRRCINKDPMDLIEREYKRHTAYRSPEHPGGYEPLNMQFIRDFDCSLLAN